MADLDILGGGKEVRVGDTDLSACDFLGRFRRPCEKGSRSVCQHPCTSSPVELGSNQ